MAALTQPFNKQVASLTEEDIVRITERERQKPGDKESNENIEQAIDWSTDTIAQDDPSLQPGNRRKPITGGATSSESADSPPESLSTPKLLMGVPVATGPNVTKFLYAELPHESGTSPGNGTEPAGNQFGAEDEAARLCGDLHDNDSEKEAFSSCLSSLTSAIHSRYADGSEEDQTTQA